MTYANEDIDSGRDEAPTTVLIAETALQLDQLEKSVEQLSMRLRPVLAESEPDGPTALREALQGSSVVAIAINGHRMRIEEVVASLQRLQYRLEI